MAGEKLTTLMQSKDSFTDLDEEVRSLLRYVTKVIYFHRCNKTCSTLEMTEQVCIYISNLGRMLRQSITGRPTLEQAHDCSSTIKHKLWRQLATSQMKCRAFKTCYNCSKLKYFEIVSKPASIMYSRFSYKQKTIENFQESSALYQDALSDDSPVYENLHQLIVMSNTNSKEKNPSANIFHLSTSR